MLSWSALLVDRSTRVPPYYCGPAGCIICTMDNSNWRPPPPGVGGGGEAAPETDDWRKQLPPESRQRIVNKM